MAKVVYLLGAGASADAIPPNLSLAKTMANMAIKFTNGFGGGVQFGNSEIFKTHHWLESEGVKVFKYYIELKKALSHFGIRASREPSIDTLAKKLYIQGLDPDYRKLKATMASYFYLYDKINPDTDLRYDSFFAALIDSKGDVMLPSNVSILSWNYDYQLEKSLAKFLTDRSHENVRNKLNIIEPKSPLRDIRNRFFVHKINGTASVNFNDLEMDPYYDLEVDTKLQKEAMEKLLACFAFETDYYEWQTGNNSLLNNGLQFAWEDFQDRNHMVDAVCKELEKATVLVVIGYTFPYFNRAVDRRFLKSMPHLNRIYIQTLESAMNSTRTSMEAALTTTQVAKIPGGTIKVKEIPISDDPKKRVGDQFFLPPEL